MGLILDSSVVITAERPGQTAYQMLGTIRERSGDAEIAVSVVLELAHGIERAILKHGAPDKSTGNCRLPGDAVATGNTRHFEMIPGLVVRPF